MALHYNISPADMSSDSAPRQRTLIFPMHLVESAAHLESGAEDFHGTFDGRVSAEAQVVLNLAAPASV
jgi:hypothetical protein